MPEDFATQLERCKLEALKELAYGASHEINNPLANIAARAQALLREESHPDRQRALEAIYQQAMRAHEMISDLMLFARPPRLEKTQVHLNELVAEAIGQSTPAAAASHIELSALLPEEPVVISADGNQILVALLAVVKNALEAIGQNGMIEISLSRQIRDTWNRAVVEIHDTGPGIPPEIRAHLFDPFFSGREAGRGLGFGLSKAWRIVTDHGGEIIVDSIVGRGTTFALHLPCNLPLAADG